MNAVGGAAARGTVGHFCSFPGPWMLTSPFKLNQDRRRHIPKQTHKVMNSLGALLLSWRAYDASLRQRGSLTVWFTDGAIEGWRAVVCVDAGARRIMCADGTAVDYTAALLATGGTSSRTPVPGAGLENVYTLRSRADADAILEQAERSACAVILGAGFIGMEVAASLRERGLDVTVVGKEAAPFEKQLGPQVGGAFVGLHERHGVAFRLGSEVAALEGDDRVSGVRLNSGELVPADLVVAGFGVKPATSYAAGLDRNEDGGIKVDAYLRATDGGLPRDWGCKGQLAIVAFVLWPRVDVWLGC